MQHSQSKYISKQPLANRSSSPDLPNSHHLGETKSVSILFPDRNKQQRIPLLHQINFLASQNQQLKQQLISTSGLKSKRGQDQDKQTRDLKNHIVEKASRKLNLTLNDPSVLRSSVDKRRPPSQLHNNQRSEIEGLKSKILELEKQNQGLRKSLLKKGIQSFKYEASNNNPQLQKAKQELADIMKQKLLKLQEMANGKIKQLQKRIQYLQRVIRPSNSNSKTNSQQHISSSRRKISLISPQKRQSANEKKRVSFSYLTPTREQKSDIALKNLEEQLLSAKNNIKQLQKENANLSKQNYSYKKDYDELIIKQQKQTSYFTPSVYNPQSERYNNSESQKKANLMKVEKEYEKLQRDNKQLGLKNAGLERRFVEMQNDLRKMKSHMLIQSSQFSQVESYQMPKRLKQQLKKISQLQQQLSYVNIQKETLKRQLFSNNNESNSKIYDRLNFQQQENFKLLQKNTVLQNNIKKLNYQIQLNRNQVSSNQAQLLYFKKRVEQLESKYRGPQSHVYNGRTYQNNDMNEELKKKNFELNNLQQQFNRVLSFQQKQNNQNEGIESDRLKTQLNETNIKLQEANRMIQIVGRIDLRNINQLQSSLRDLESVKRMLDSINFVSLEGNLKQLGMRYREIVQQRISMLKLIQDKISQMKRVTNDNEKKNRQTLEFSSKYINQRSQRQKLESLLGQQRQQTRILQEQVNNLNLILNQYINKQSAPTAHNDGEDSRIRQLDQAVVDDQAQRNILQLKELERQFQVVSDRLQEIMNNINHNLNDSKDQFKRTYT